MGRIIKHLKPYWKSVILVICLLVVQAVCELSLPTYTSKIIDVGIQSGGVQHIVPEEILPEEYELAKLFMSEEEKDTWISLYEEADGKYLLNENNEKALEEVDEKLMIPIVLSYQLGHMEETAFKEMLAGMMAQSPETAGMAEAVKGMSLSEIKEQLFLPIAWFTSTNPDGSETNYVDVRAVIAGFMNSNMMDNSMLMDSKEKMNATIENIGSTALKSMGIQYARSCEEAAGMDMEKVQMDFLWNRAAIMLGFSLVMLFCAISISFISSRVGAGLGCKLREQIFTKVMGFSNAEINQFSSASLITRATNDVVQIVMVCIFMMRMIFYAPIIGIGGIIRVAKSGADMGWIIALAVILLLGFVAVLVSIAMPKFKIMQEKVDNVNLVSRELLTGLSVIRAFGRERKEEQRFEQANKALKDTQLFTARTMTVMMPGMTLIMNGIVVLITWISAKHIDAGTLQVGAMTAFITYTMQIVMSFLMLSAISIMLPRASVAAERIDAVLNTESSIKDAPETIALAKDGKGVLKFEHVSFHYPDAAENVLTDLDFTAEPGKVTAIIGSTGCGKSSLVNLIPRFYDVTEGKITLDGKDIRELALGDLRAQIGFVPQKGVLFSGTIASNLKFADKDMSEEQMILAAQIAQAEEFIEAKEEGYESFIAQGGSNVSGGQKQRLAIARAIAKNPLVYVFDDSFSALDMKTDAKLRKALHERVQDRTQIIVAQRISTILHAEQILVLDQGRIVGKGTHEELLRSCEVYREIATSQLSKKELGLDTSGGKEEK